MSVIATPVGAVTRQRPGTRAKVGLGLAVLLGLTNLPSAFTPTPDGQTGPPIFILVLGTVLGLTSIICALWAWRTGNRIAIRLTAATMIINTVSALPGLFVDIPAFIKAAIAVTSLATIAAVVLMFSRPRPAVSDVRATP